MGNKRYALGIYENDMSSSEERFAMRKTTDTKLDFQTLVLSNKTQNSIEYIINMWNICKQRGETQYRLFMIMNEDDPKNMRIAECKNRPVFDK